MIRLTSDRTKVFKNTKEDGSHYFTYSISNKKQDGTYEYMSKICKFMKDKEPSDTCTIKIDDSFMSFYTSGDKKNDYLMIMKYDVLEGSTSESNIGDELVLTDDDLPF